MDFFIKFLGMKSHLKFLDCLWRKENESTCVCVCVYVCVCVCVCRPDINRRSCSAHFLYSASYNSDITDRTRLDSFEDLREIYQKPPGSVHLQAVEL